MAGPEVRGVLLDVDGTLVNSVDAHARAWVAALSEAGFEVPYARVRALIGMGGDRVLPILTGLSEDSDAGRRIAGRRAERFLADEAPALRPTRGARAFLDVLFASGAPVAVATSADPDELRVLLDVVGARSLLEVAASAEAVGASKPAPDVVHAALDRIGLPAGSVILIGDTGYDIEAGANAGVATIALRSGGWTDEDLAGAIERYDDLADLLGHLDGSALGPLLAATAATATTAATAG